MKPTMLTCLAVLVVATSFASPAHAGGNANFVLGERWMNDKSEWEPWDTQDLLGVNVDFGAAKWPIHLETGIQASTKTETIFATDVTGSVTEVFFGVNKTWDTGSGKTMHPYVGGGVSSVTAKLEASGTSIDDTSAGFYVHGGIFWRLGSRFNIGFDVRALGGTSMSFDGLDFSANSTQAGLVLGWGWPRTK